MRSSWWFLALLLGACAGAEVRAPTARSPVVVLAPLDVEFESAVRALAGVQRFRLDEREAARGEAGGLPVIVVRTGWGKSHAAGATALAIERFHPAVILLAGIGGGLDREIADSGDVVVGAATFQHDLGRLDDDGRFHRWAPESPLEQKWPLLQPADASALAAVQGALAVLKFEPWCLPQSGAVTAGLACPAGAKRVGRVAPRACAGTLGTGDSFVEDAFLAKDLTTAGAAALDMETAAAALEARNRGTPFVSLRVMADVIGSDGGYDRYLQLKTAGAERLAQLLPAVLRGLQVRSTGTLTPCIPPPVGARETLRPARRVDQVEALAREPTLLRASDGSLFVAGYGETPQARSRLWKSADGGATWTLLDVGGQAGDSDVHLAQSKDGTLYFATMQFNREKLRGERISVGASRDGGATWSWSVLAQKPYVDRPWVAVTPDGVAHVIWNDGQGVLLAQSRDQGASWSPPRRITDHGGSSHFVAGPRGELAVRLIRDSASGFMLHPLVDSIAISRDGGATWTERAAPGKRTWANQLDLQRWVEPLAWSASGELYSLWTEGRDVWLARSGDAGETWTAWRLHQAGGLAWYPFVVAQDGVLAATWFEGVGEDLRWRAARIAPKPSGPPEVDATAPLDVTAFGPDGVPSTAGEYLGVAVLEERALGVVTPLGNGDRRGFRFWQLSR